MEKKTKATKKKKDGEKDPYFYGNAKRYYQNENDELV